MANAVSSPAPVTISIEGGDGVFIARTIRMAVT